MAETFETLKAKLGDWMGVGTVRLPDTVRGDALNLIQRRLLRNHDLRFGEMVDTLAVSASTREYVLPTGWRSPLSLWYINPNSQGLVGLTWMAKDLFDVNFPDPTKTGTPANYTTWGGALYLGPTPDLGFTLNRNYYRFLPDLTDAAPTNAFVEQAWDVLFYGALEEISMYSLEDARAPLWGAKFRELESDLADEHRRERSSGRVAQSREPG